MTNDFWVMLNPQKLDLWPATDKALPDLVALRHLHQVGTKAPAEVGSQHLGVLLLPQLSVGKAAS